MIQLPAVFPDHDQIRGTAKNQIHRRNIDIGRAKGQNRGEISVLAKPQSPLIKKAISVARIQRYIANSLQMK